MRIRQRWDPDPEDKAASCHDLLFSTSWYNMAASCARTSLLHFSKCQEEYDPFPEPTSHYGPWLNLFDPAVISVFCKWRKKTIVAAAWRLMKIFPDLRKGLAFADPDLVPISVLINWLHLSGFRFADDQHYFLQPPRRVHCNKSERRVTCVFAMIPVFGCKCGF